MLRPLLRNCFFLLILVGIPLTNKGYHKSILSSGFSSAIEQRKESHELTIMTLNLWGLPIWMPGHHQSKRFKRAPGQLLLSGMDILCFQEVFSRKLRKKLLTGLDTIYNVYSDYQCNEPIFGPIVKDCHGGLMTLSKYPIIEEVFYPYPIWDGMRWEEKIGAKGFLISTIDVHGEKVFIINTHMYAGMNDKDATFRLQQLMYMNQVIASNPELEHHKVILMGDLNVRHIRSALRGDIADTYVYNYLLYEMQFQDVQSYNFQNMYTIDHEHNPYTSASEPKQKLDYILYRFPCNSQWMQCQQELIFNNHQSVSDHLGVTATLSIPETASDMQELPSIASSE